MDSLANLPTVNSPSNHQKKGYDTYTFKLWNRELGEAYYFLLI